MTSLSLSVCPSVSRWNAVDSQLWIPSQSMTRLQGSDSNCGPWSEKTFKGSRCKYQIRCIKRSARSIALTSE